jgi:hypothetical protein
MAGSIETYFNVENNKSYVVAILYFNCYPSYNRVAKGVLREKILRDNRYGSCFGYARL